MCYVLPGPGTSRLLDIIRAGGQNYFFEIARKLISEGKFSLSPYVRCFTTRILSS